MSSTQVVGLLVPYGWILIQYGRTLVQYGGILVQYGRIWYQKWSKNIKNNVFPEMTQKGFEMVPMASGSPGNAFL